jgi:hypothetical protein
MKRKRWEFAVRRFQCFGVLALIATPVLLAQGTGPNDEELRKAAQNPVASLISVPFQNNTNFPVGHYSRVQNVVNVQPVIPVSLRFAHPAGRRSE